MVYARDTNVTVNRTREEIISTLEKYGADSCAYTKDGHHEVIFFRMEGHQARLTLAMPNPIELTFTPTGIRRTGQAHINAYNHARGQRLRAWLMLIKAKLEGVAAGITTVDKEFLPHIQYPPEGTTIGEFIHPKIKNS